MGGRLDATNAILDDAVVASALTNVNLGHQGFPGMLGSPQKISVVLHLSSYRSPVLQNRSEGNCPIMVRTSSQIMESPRQSAPSFLRTLRVRISS